MSVLMRRIGVWGLVLFVLILCPRVGHAQAGTSTTGGAMTTDGAVATAQDAPLIWQIHFDSPASLHNLTARYDVWEVRHGDGLVIAALEADEARALEDAGYRMALDTELSRRIADDAVRAAASTAGIPGYACYRTVEETYADLSALAEAYPQLATWTDFGDSWEKSMPGGKTGYDLFALRLTNTAIPGPKPKLIIMSAIHAREYVTAEVATRFAEELAAGYGVDPEITWLLDFFELHLIPQANPDGRKIAEGGEYWRKNTDSLDGCFSSYGIDLNRNSSFKWNECDGFGCSSGFPCDLTYRGRSPASEPETQAIQAYLADLLPDQRGPGDGDAAPPETENLFISIHSYSELILFPWGWTAEKAPNHAALQTLARKFAYATGYRACQAGAPGCLYQTDGTTDDWSYGTLGVASFTFELGTAFFQSCAEFKEQILPDNLAALRYGFKTAHRPYLAPAGPEVTQIQTMTQTGAITNSVLLTVTADDGRTVSDPIFGAEPIQTIAGARYSIDAPTWVTGTVHYPLSPPAQISTTAVLTGVIDTNLLTQPRHLLLVEAQDADGNWGVPTAVFLDVALDYLFAVDGPAAPQAAPGETVTQTVTVSNTGLVSDTYSLVVEDEPWIVEFVQFQGVVAPGEAAVAQIVVRIPNAALPGASLRVDAEVHSAGDPGRIIGREFVINVVSYDLYLPLIGGAGPGSDGGAGP